MGDLSSKLSLNTKEFNQSLNSAKDSVKDFQSKADDANKSLKGLRNTGTRTAAELLNEMDKMNDANRSVSNYNRQLKEMQKKIVDLTVNYRSMTDEMKNSPLGQEMAAKIQEMTMEAANLKDAVGDVQEEIMKLSSDTAVWDGMRQGIDVVSSGLQAFIAVGAFSEDTTEKLVKVLAKLRAMEVATNAVIKIGNALQKNSALIGSITTLQTKALAHAKELEAASTGKATVAQKLFNTVAKANPYVLLAAAIATVIAAVVTYTTVTKKLAKTQNQAQKALENFDKKLSTIGKEVGTAVAKYKVLQGQYQALRTEAEKTQWIKDNQDGLEDLNLAIKNVNDADDVFIKQASKVVQVMKLRAEAAAMLGKYQEAYAEAYEKSMEIENTKTKSYSANSWNDEWKKAGLTDEDVTSKFNGSQFADGGYTSFELTESGKNKLKAYYKKLAEDVMKEYEAGAVGTFEEIQSKLVEAAQIEAEVGKFGVTKKGTEDKKELIAEKGSYAEAKNRLAELQEILEHMGPDNEKFEETKQKVIDATAEVKRLKDLLDFSDKEIFPEGSLSEANKQVSDIQAKLLKAVPNTDEFRDLLRLLDEWKKKQKDINDLISQQDPGTILDFYRKIQSEASDISLQFKIGAIDRTEADRMILDLNKQLAEKGLTARVSLEIDKKELYESLNDFVDEMDKITSAFDIVNEINSVYEAFKNLNSNLAEAENGWERFFVIFQTGMTVLQAVTGIISAISTVMEIFNTVKQASTAATNKDTVATLANVGAQQAEAQATMQAAGASTAKAAADAGDSVAKIPYVGAFIAIAAITAVLGAMIGVIAAVKGFATGGIVDGPSRIGDHNLIAVNGNEMVLTERQQANLFKLLNEGRTTTNYTQQGSVQFRVSGQELVGVLNNYNKKISKL